MESKQTKPRCRVSSTAKKVRINTVFEMLIEGQATVAISDYCMDTWGVTRSTSYQYMRDADKMLSEILEGKKVSKVNRAVALRETLIQKLIESKNLPMAFQIMMDKSKLENLYAQSQTDVDVNIEVKQK